MDFRTTPALGGLGRVRPRRQYPGSQSPQAPSKGFKRRRQWGERTMTDRTREDEEEIRKANKRNLGREHQQQEEEVSSACSSPIREPYIPEEFEPVDPKTREAFKLAHDRFEQKIAHHITLPTICPAIHLNCLDDDPNLLPIRQSSKKIVLSAAKFVLGLSSFVGGKLLARCSGFLIDWDDKNNEGIVLTTAQIICSRKASSNTWLCMDEYASDAKVVAHFRDGTFVKGCLLYYQKHYDLAFFRVRVDHPVQLPSFNDAVEFGQKVFEVGRDQQDKLMINYGRVEYLNPILYERNHYMYVDGAHRVRQYDNGGPVIDLDGKVVGMVNNSSRGSFIPSSVLLKCLRLWRTLKCIPRPHLGLKFSAIRFKDIDRIENISRLCGIDEGLIVDQVAEGSAAEDCGIRVGDVIERFNGEDVSTTVELENMLLSICEGNGNCVNSEVDVVIQVYHTRKCCRKIKTLTVNVSDDREFIAQACYPFTSGDGSSASGSSPSGPRSTNIFHYLSGRIEQTNRSPHELLSVHGSILLLFLASCNGCINYGGMTLCSMYSLICPIIKEYSDIWCTTQVG